MKGIKSKKSLLLAFVITLLFLTNVQKISAASGAAFGIELYTCTQDQWDDEECFADNTKEMDSDVMKLIPQGSDLEPGQQFVLAITYKHGNVDYQAIQTYINYDSNQIQFIEGYHDRGPTYVYDGVIPPVNPTGSAANKRNTNWKTNVGVGIGTSLYGDAINFSIRDTEEQPMRAGDEGIVYYYLFQVVDDPSLGGQTISLSFIPGESEGTVRSTLAADRDILYTNASYNIFGTMSTDSSLSHLEVKGSTYSYPLVERVGEAKSYDVVVPYNVTNVDLIAIVNDINYATITIPNPYNKVLAVGNNTITFTVTAQNGSISVYSVYVKRLSNDVTLSNLEASGITLDYNVSTKTYFASVPYLTTNTNITASASHANAVVSGTGAWNLSNIGGVNTKVVNVQAEDCASIYASVQGNTCTQESYTIEITRAAASTNADLANLTVDGVAVAEFNANTYDYYLDDVAYAKTNLNINAVIADPLSAIVSGLGNVSLVVGNNTFEVVTLAEDGINTKTYKIHVRRKSNDATLDNLVITSTPQGTLDPVFNPSLFNYHTFNIDATVSSINVVATKNHDKQTITGDVGNIAITGNSMDLSITVTSEDGNINTYIIKVRKALSSDNTLSSLTISSGTLSPAFASATTLYTANVGYEVSSIDVAAITNSTQATILNGLGTHSLNVGTNVIQVRVQAENGVTKDYTITVTRGQNSDATLSDLTINGETIENFNSATITYDLGTIPYSSSSIVVNGLATDSNANVSGFTTYNLNTGSNEIKIVVTAADGVTKITYTLNVVREKNNDNTLKSLTINNSGHSITPAFNSEIDTYEVILPSNINNFSASDLVAVANDSKAIISYDSSIAINENATTAYRLVVTAENNETKTYTLNVKRAKDSVSTLSSLEVKNQNNILGSFAPSFNPNTLTYTVGVPVDTTSINITGVVSGRNATISGDGIHAITGDETVVITVTAEDGTTTDYTLNIVREKSGDNTLKTLTVNPASLNEAFIGTNTLYTASVSYDVTSIEIAAEVNDSNATIVSGLGTKSLNVGINTFQVRVKAENGTTKDYTITITREKSTNANLADILIDGVSISDFEANIYEYNLALVENSKTSVEISAVKDQANQTISGLGTINLATGNNRIEIVVTAQDGITSNTYVINLPRDVSDYQYLNAIKIDNVLIDGFVYDTNTYNITVPNNVTSLNLTYEKGNSGQTVTISGNSGFVTTANNVVNITVVSEKGSLYIYTINVIRTKSNVNTLSNILLSDGLLNPAFNELTDSYTVSVARAVTNITITPVLKDASATAVVNGNTALSIGNNNFTIEVTAEDGTIKEYSVVIVRQASNNTYLSDLTIDGTTISGFTKTNRSYTVNVSSEVSSVLIGGTAEYPEYTNVEGLTSYNLTTGINVINIKVIAEDGTDGTYTININRLTSANNYLNSLSIQETPLIENFEQNKYNYTAVVAYSVDTINILAEAADSRATVSGDGTKTLNTGDNTFQIVVTAEDNTTKTYTIVVTRAKNSDATLKNITLSGGFVVDPAFNPNITTYNVTVPNVMSSINVIASKTDAKAKVVGDGIIALNSGNNEVNITVTAENGTTTKTYTINIYREKSTNAYIRNVTSTDGIITPDWDKLVNFGYEITVANSVINLNLNITKDDEASSYIVSGDTNLSVGNNTVNIMVTPEDGSINIYTIIVKREASDNNYLSSLSVKNVDDVSYPMDFTKTNLEYTVNVANNIDQIIISATADSDTAVIRTALGTKNLAAGVNRFEIVVRSESGIDRTYVLNIVRAASGNANLSNLVVTDYNISPTFSSGVTLYALTVGEEVEEVEIVATAESANAKIIGTGTKTLVTGPNTFQISVTSENGEVTKDYTVVITRVASNNNYLSSLTVSEGTLDPVFNKNINSYIVNVGYEISSIEIGAIAENNKAVVSGAGTKNLATGSNVFDIIVKAEDNTTKTYTITVNRGQSSNKLLLDLTVDGSTIEGFASNKYNYTINVGNTKTSIDIKAFPIDTNATVIGDGTISLNTGVNTVNITIVAENGTTELLKINVTRAKSSNNYLSSLTAAEGILSPSFNKEVSDYSITVPFEVRSLNLTAIVEDASANVSSIDGNSEFNTGSGNVVTINVVAEDGSIRSYRVLVTRQTEANNFLSSLQITDVDGKVYSLDKAFNKNTLSYNVVLPVGVNEVIINASKENAAATIVGKGSLNTTNLPLTHTLTVTSSGISRSYTINFVRALSDNSKLLDIESDIGTIDFNASRFTYILNVPSDTTGINLTATKSEASQLVVGDGYHAITSNQQLIDIMVTSENGNSSIYTIVVIKEAATALRLNDLSVENYAITPVFNKDTFEYRLNITDESITNVNVIATKANAAHSLTISGHDTLVVGENLITVTLEHNGDITIYTIIVNIDASVPKKITSDIHTLTSDYIMSFAPEKTALDLKNELTNDNAYLKVYDQDGIELSDSSTTYVGTGMVVKLEIDGIVYDELTIVVKGDTDGNGEIEAVDARAIAVHVIGGNQLVGAYFEAGYLSDNDDVEIEALHARTVALHVIGQKPIEYKE